MAANRGTDSSSYYLVELIRPESGFDDVQAVTARSRAACVELTRSGTPVRFLRSIFVPEDGSCFFLFQAPTPDAVREAAALAQLGIERVRRTIGADPQLADRESLRGRNTG
jgi:hypothetical protein